MSTAAGMGLLSGRVVIVTGAGRGIGAGVARVCAREGADLVLVDLDRPESVTATSNVFDTDGLPPHHADHETNVHWILGDVTDARVIEEVELAAAQMLATESASGVPRSISLVSNAGIDHRGHLATLTREEIDRVFAINTGAALLFSQATLRLHRELRRSRGDVDVPGPREGCEARAAPANPRDAGPCSPETAASIVLVSSVQAASSMGHATLYAATKSAMTGIVLSGAIELGGEGVRINGVMPTISGTRRVWGGVCSDHGAEAVALSKWGKNIPLGRPVSLDEIGDTIAWLLSPRASGITGTMMPIDAGNLAQLVSVDAANIN